VTDSLQVIRERLGPEVDWDVPQKDLVQTLYHAYDGLDLPHPGRVRIVKLQPKGSLLHFSTAGVYLPFLGQGHIDAGLHPITHPFTMLHEMSHGYGWTGEDACNFLALICAVNSTNDQVKYSGYFGYWRYLRTQVFLLDRSLFDLEYRIGPPSVMNDYKEILAYSDRYVEILPELRDLFYDSYLKSHGISSGLVNYCEMILLAYQWKSQHTSLRLKGISQ